ncbi:MAG: hypothetical protein Q9227_004049 [Pyrenula ochraceoflavens]
MEPQLRFSEDWQVLGPFKIGTREGIWGADPLEYIGGFHNVSFDSHTVFRSPLAQNGTTSWKTVHAENVASTGQIAKSTLDIYFTNVDWQSLALVYGWTALQYQGWARGYLENPSSSPRRVRIFSDSILEFWLDNEHFFGGDMYRYRKSPVIASLKPGKNVFEVRLVRDVRAMGGVGDTSIRVTLEARTVEPIVHITGRHQIFPEKVNGRLPSPYASVLLCNAGERVAVVRIGKLYEGSESVSTTSSAPILLYPGQTRPFGFVISLSHGEVSRISFGVEIEHSNQGEHADMTTQIVSVLLTERSMDEPHRFTFLHRSGSVSYAIVRPPPKQALTLGRERLPVLLNLHGAGLDADSDQVRHTLDEAADLAAWILFPTGMTPWSGDDWHTWGFADVKAAISAISDWITAVNWHGPGVDKEQWFVSGHSNGGKSYGKALDYVPYTLWNDGPPILTSIIQSALSNYKHELFLPNLDGIPILLQHGSADDNVPAYHSRLMNALLSEASTNATYNEIDGAGHWFDGVMTTPSLLRFYKAIINREISRPNVPLNFTLVVTSSDDFGTRGGLYIDQVESPDQLAKIYVQRDDKKRVWQLSTSNVYRFSLDTRQLQLPDRPEVVALDREWIELSSKYESYMFVKTEGATWKLVQDKDGWKRISQRHGRQRGAMDAILRTNMPFHITAGKTPEELAIALQISRNFLQYFSADASISIPCPPLMDHSEGNVISVGIRAGFESLSYEDHPISIEAEHICLNHTMASRRTCYPYKPGLGAIFLSPLANEQLQLIVWGYDEAGLRQAARLVPTLTGAGQPDFVILADECRWKGHAGVLAAGFFDYAWRISSGSYLARPPAPPPAVSCASSYCFLTYLYLALPDLFILSLQPSTSSSSALLLDHGLLITISTFGPQHFEHYHLKSLVLIYASRDILSKLPDRDFTAGNLLRMSSLVSTTGSPKLTRKNSPGFTILEQAYEKPRSDGQSGKPGEAGNGSPAALVTSKLGNLQSPSPSVTVKPEKTSQMEDILARLRANDNHEATPTPSGTDTGKPKAVNAILSNLNDQLKKQKESLNAGQASAPAKEHDSSFDSDGFTPASDSFDMVSAGTDNSHPSSDTEMNQMKQQLAEMKAKLRRQDVELAETRTFKHTMDQAMGPPSETDFNHRDINDNGPDNSQSAFNASARPFTARQDSGVGQDGFRPDQQSDAFVGGFNRGNRIWDVNQPSQILNNSFGSSLSQQVPFHDNRSSFSTEQDWSRNLGGTGYMNPGQVSPTHRVFSGPTSATFGMDGRFMPDQNQFTQNGTNRRTVSGFNKSGSGFSSRSAQLGSLGANTPISTSTSAAPLGYTSAFGYQPRPIGSSLSPTASDFSGGNSLAGVAPFSGGPLTGSALPATALPGPPMPNYSNPWNPMPSITSPTYLAPLEPLNYRRLLDKSVNCDWKYIVDKIVCNNDQQASIFLQQKLKVGTAEQKFEIVEAIVNQAYPLMINRFGNFLVQRCFEHGTPEQVVAIAEAIHGNVLSLSCDPFGCHVIQKAFDSVPEKHKADMVRELLRRIPDTVIHRYACHVWQKLFELRWSGEPPQIMVKVNDALRGMWHEVALGETGSLVVQNIFENCVEEEKRPAIEEVVANIDLIAHGQFGNWCIQHLCEHGAPADKRRVIDHILANAYQFSIDQFASKVVEKCLKIGGVDFLERYLGVITTPLPDRPRIPLIDIAGDQYGNYLIQWILMNTHHHQREQVAIHIR